MQTIKQTALALVLLVFIASCGNSKKDSASIINEKKVELEKLKKEKNETEVEIKKLEDELALIDTAAGNNAKVKLVGIAPVTTKNFEHYIDLQGKIDAENISYISPRGMGGQVRAVYVKEGQAVRKGQLLLKLDDAIVRQQVAAARQQAEGIKTQLNFNRTIYNRQKNLWDQGIGTEVQLITAKTNVENYENQLRLANEQVKLAMEQLNTTNVYSDVNGIADLVNIKVGETFTGMTAAGPQIKVVNTSSLKMVTNVPENYISRLKKGMPVVVSIPDAGRRINSTISLISQSVDLVNRGFIAEAKIPYDASLKPNQTAVMKILDYKADSAIVIPVNMVQTDEKGKYVYVLSKLSNGKSIAKKKQVQLGEIYGNDVEIKTGLNAGEQLITEGFQNLYEGQLITTETL